MTIPSHRFIAGLVALAASWLGAGQATAARLAQPDVPIDVRVSDDHRLYLVGHAVGTQNYVCVELTPGQFAWTPFGPQATLFSDDDDQLVTHFLSANPDEGGTYRATWQHSRDTSAVWGLQVGISSDSAYVEGGAIPWLKLQVVGAQDGPTGGHRLSRTSFIQRLNTHGGIAPATGCTSVGKRALVPYTTDYYFYTPRAGRE